MAFARTLSPTVSRLALAAVQARALLTRDHLVWHDIAWAGATCGVLASRRSRRIAAAGLRVLGREATRGAVWRFAWSCWYQRAADVALAHQAERLTDTWAEHHVALSNPSRPARLGSSVLVTIHHANQRLGFLRLAPMMERLGVVSDFVPTSAESAAGAPELDRQRALSHFSARIFGPRLFPPARAPRPALDLLGRGGSLIVLPDFYEGGPPASILGRRVPVADGAIWFARQANRPIVPFVVSPAPEGWRLWVGEPVPPERAAVAAALESCVRRAPTAWFGWPDWYAAPAMHPAD